MVGNGAGRAVRVLLAAGLLTTAALVGTAGSASAATANPVCDAFSADANGNPTGAALATGVALPALNLPDLTGGPVETGTAFEASTPSSPVTLPADTTIEFPPGSGTMISATVAEVKNMKLTFDTAGAASIGQPVLSGGNVLGASAVVNNLQMVFTLPGSQSGSTVGGGDAYFPGGSTFTPPALAIPVAAPNSPGTITTTLTGLTLNVKVLIGGVTPLPIALLCTANAQIGSVSVVAPPPPPPGAPDAVNDTATTEKGTAVTVDVTKNDTKDSTQAALDIDYSSLAITSNPTKGKAEIVDGKAVYTPNADAVGTDSFKYTLCSVLPATGGEAACDIATVSITITDAAAASTTTTTVQAAAAPTTVAAAELPRTGSSSTPLALIGVFVVASGLSLAGLFRRPRHAR